MQLLLVPSFTIFLINVCIIVWVLRMGDRSRSGFFLLTNALALVIWAGGHAMFRAIGTESPLALALPYFAALLVPCNLLFHALSRPRPLRPFWGSGYALALTFLPAVVLTVSEPFGESVGLLFSYSYRVDAIPLSSPTTRSAALFCAFALMLAVVILAVRYNQSTGPERNTSKHLIAAIVGPLLFAAFFWASSAPGAPKVIPSPSLIFAMMAQLSLFAVLRQEEITDARLLTRAVYYLAALLVAFLFVNLLMEFYAFVDVVRERTAGWILLGTVLALLLFLRLSRGDAAFERMMFRRAAEYRRLVDEARHELLDARERLRRSERLSVIGELAARVAHEIKNPLGPIKGYTQMMREKLEHEPDFRHRAAFLRHLGVIAEEVETIDRRLRDLLNAARQPQMIIEELDVNRLVERCGRLLELELAARSEIATDEEGEVTISVVLAEDLPVLRGDAGRLEEALYNVARNALEALAGRPEGHIHLETRLEPGSGGEEGVAILVHDDGPGFPPEHLAKVFESFFTTKDGGTGLGLAIVRSTFEAHGGTATARNHPVAGAEVRLWLPRVMRENPGALLPKA